MGGSCRRRLLVYAAADALRQIEIGLASFLSVLFGLTLIASEVSIFLSTRYPAWLGIGLLDGVGLLAAGAAQASMGFSALGPSR
jgi:hypothetical protein